MAQPGSTCVFDSLAHKHCVVLLCVTGIIRERRPSLSQLRLLEPIDVGKLTVEDPDVAVLVLSTQLECFLVVDDRPTVLSDKFIAFKLAVGVQSVACPCRTTQKHTLFC